jgi:hypothetical protein
VRVVEGFTKLDPFARDAQGIWRGRIALCIASRVPEPLSPPARQAEISGAKPAHFTGFIFSA